MHTPRRRHSVALFILVTCFVTLLSGCLYFSTDRQINYGINHYRMGLYNQAIPPLVTAAKSLEEANPQDPILVEVLLALGEMALSTDRKDLAADFFPRALRAAEALNPPDNTRLRNSLVGLGMFYLADRPADAVPLLERAETISRDFDDQVLHAIDLDNLALAYQGIKDFPRASDLSLKALEVIETTKTGKLIVRTKGVILHNLAMSYVEMGRFGEAEARFKESLAVLRSAPHEVELWRIRTVTKNYAALLRRTGRAKEADELERQPGFGDSPRFRAGSTQSAMRRPVWLALTLIVRPLGNAVTYASRIGTLQRAPLCPRLQPAGSRALFSFSQRASAWLPNPLQHGIRCNPARTCMAEAFRKRAEACYPGFWEAPFPPPEGGGKEEPAEAG